MTDYPFLNSNVREHLNAATKEIEKQYSVAARQLNLSQYFESDSQQNAEENSSEDSLMEDRHRKSNSLPRPPRWATKYDFLRKFLVWFLQNVV